MATNRKSSQNEELNSDGGIRAITKIRARPLQTTVQHESSFPNLTKNDKERLQTLLRNFAELDLKNQALQNDLDLLETRNKELESTNADIRMLSEKYRESNECMATELGKIQSTALIKDMEVVNLASKIKELESRLREYQSKLEDSAKYHQDTNEILTLAAELNKLTAMLPRLQDTLKESSLHIIDSTTIKNETLNHTTLVESMQLSEVKSPEPLPKESPKLGPKLKDASTSPVIRAMNRTFPKELRGTKRVPCKRCESNQKTKCNCQCCPPQTVLKTKAKHKKKSIKREGQNSFLIPKDVIIDLKSQDESLLFSNDNSMLVPLEDIVFDMESLKTSRKTVRYH